MLLGENCGYSMYNCVPKVNHYFSECPRDWYGGMLYEYMNNYDLPLSKLSTINNSKTWVKETCGNLRKRGKYELNKGFAHGDWPNFPLHPDQRVTTWVKAVEQFNSLQIN
jgi:hypothetical protein